VAFAPDGRVFVAEKQGVIKVFSDLEDETPTVFADLTENVYNAYDRGLLAIALHPDFSAQPYVYALYSYDADIDGVAPKWGTVDSTSDGCPDPPGVVTDGCVISGRLSRLTATGDAMTEEVELIHDWCQQFPSHSIGDLEFGRDGSLYVSGGEGANFSSVDYGQFGNPPDPCGIATGDGPADPLPSAEGGALRSQDFLTDDDPLGLNGTVIRVDPITGAGLLPDVDPDSARIVAYGFRNPFRIAQRPGTDQIFVADTGWVDFDEIDRFPGLSDARPNFGWPCFEGSGRQPEYESLGLSLCGSLYGDPDSVKKPFFVYRHNRKVSSDETGCRIRGGAVSGLEFYAGGSYPDQYDGALFFSDYSRDCIWVMDTSPTGVPDPARIRLFANAPRVVDLVRGPGGDLFYVDIGGSVRRISYIEGNQPPVVKLSASPSYGPVPVEVALDASASYDPEGELPLTYEWDLDNDGIYEDGDGPTADRTFTEKGDHEVWVKVTDQQGGEAKRSVTISAGNLPPTVEISGSALTDRWKVGDTINLEGQGTDPDEGPVRGPLHRWQVFIRHCFGTECHLHLLSEFTGRKISFAAPDHETPVSLSVRLKVEDSRGLAASKRVRLRPMTTKLRLKSKPAGAHLSAGSNGAVAPFVHTAVVRSGVSLIAPETRKFDGMIWRFHHWSDGGERVHTVTARVRTRTFKAFYRASK
jgi:glucose/arabinose dehydrogenase